MTGISIANPDIGPDAYDRVHAILESGQLADGPEVRQFESAFARYCGADHGVATTNGTTALVTALKALDIGDGDAVITTPFSFVASANAIRLAGATPVFADIDPDTYTLDPDSVERIVRRRSDVVGLLPVHLYGLPADMDRLLEISAAHDLVVVEDACQAHGATYRGRRTGGLGHAGCFSFYPAKNLGSFGEGGAVTTNDAALADELRMLRNVGQSEKYIHPVAGFNSRLQSMQAAVLKLKLRHLDEWNALRQRFAGRYRDLLADAPEVVLPDVKPHVDHVWHLFVMQHFERDALLSALQEQGIGAGIHYPIPIAQQEAFRGVQTVPAETPVTDVAAGRILSLPMHPHLTEEQIAHVAEAVHAFAQSKAS